MVSIVLHGDIFGPLELLDVMAFVVVDLTRLQLIESQKVSPCSTGV